MATGLVLDRLFLDHETAPGHPETPERLVAIERGLTKAGLVDRCTKLDVGPDPREWILKNHDNAYFERLQRACAVGHSYIDSQDSSISPESAAVAEEAVRRALGAVDAVMGGKVRNAFAALRPPGHHAEHHLSMGFCLFNTIAIAARYAMGQHGLHRVLILDWDVHHGNGTQHSFESDPSVYYMSLHGHPATLYPGTGFPEERGKGAGAGTTLNVPFRPRSTDRDYREAFRDAIQPEIDRFKPELVLVSAGFDAHRRDPIGNQSLESESFRWMTEKLLAAAEKYAAGRLVSLLEGGYDLPALSESVCVHVETLLDWAPAAGERLI